MASGGNDILYCVQLIFKRERCGSKPDLVDRCCEMESHMTNDDLWVLDNNRREVEREVKQRLEERCDIVRWFEAAGFEREPELQQIFKWEWLVGMEYI